MMVEELQEFEVLWSDKNQKCDTTATVTTVTVVATAMKKSYKRKDSTPVNIGGSRLQTNGMRHEDDDDRESEFVPPHILLARRFSDRMAYSLCTGNGRTLKGRDLRSVRNSILKMTGFLER